MRLIDADAFIEEARSRIDMQDMYLPIHIKEMVLDELPTVDAVPVIKCKDCRWWDYGQNEYGEWIGCKAKQLQFPFGDDFCSRAERKEE